MAMQYVGAVPVPFRDSMIPCPLPLRIPAKANAIPKGSRTVFRADAEHHRSVATLAF